MHAHVVGYGSCAQVAPGAGGGVGICRKSKGEAKQEERKRKRAQQVAATGLPGLPVSLRTHFYSTSPGPARNCFRMFSFHGALENYMMYRD